MANATSNEEGRHARAKATTANRGATFEAMTAEDERPTITVAGVHVAVYIDATSGKVCVSVDLDDAEPWLIRHDRDRTIPLEICVQGVVTFEG